MYLLTVSYFSHLWIRHLWQSVDDPTIKLVVVNNGVSDGELASWVAGQDDRVILLQAGANLGFGRGCNLGLAWIYERDPQGLVWLINPDAMLLPGAIAKLRQVFAIHPQISILGTVTVNPGGAVSFGGGSFNPATGEIIELKQMPPCLTETAWLSGCSLALNLTGFMGCPEFSSDYFLYYEDFDFCRRYIQVGYGIWLTPEILIVHHGSAIASRYPLLQIRHQIYGYLLSLAKHAHPGVARQRSLRILLAAIAQFLFLPRRSLGKLWGIMMYWQAQSR